MARLAQNQNWGYPQFPASSPLPLSPAGVSLSRQTCPLTPSLCLCVNLSFTLPVATLPGRHESFWKNKFGQIPGLLFFFDCNTSTMAYFSVWVSSRRLFEKLWLLGKVLGSPVRFCRLLRVPVNYVRYIRLFYTLYIRFWQFELLAFSSTFSTQKSVFLCISPLSAPE